MTLTFKFDCACRLCEREFDPAAPAEAIVPGGHQFSQGRIRLPRVARRHLLPRVCDDCWHDFSKWMAAKELAQHRQVGKTVTKGTHVARLVWMAEWQTEKYENFSLEVLCEWLNEALEIHARIELRDRIVEIATATDYHRKQRARRYFGYERSKTERRNWTRYAPLSVPEWVKWQPGGGA
jgi:hypothetical protein